MRNRYSGICYRCNIEVKPQEGHFERYRGGWRTIHADCAIKQRTEKEIASKFQPDSVKWLINNSTHQKISSNLGTFERYRHPDNPNLWTAWEKLIIVERI